MEKEEAAKGNATAFPDYTTDELRKRANEIAFQMHLSISPISFHAEKKLVDQMKAEIRRRENVASTKEALMTARTNTAPGSAGQNGAHTEGVKWSVMGEDLVVHADGPWTYSIATVYQPKYVRLIVAAPQMLEALKVVQTCLEERAEMYGMESDALRLVRAAIAAATGEGK